MFSKSKSLVSIAALVLSSFVASTPAMAVATCDVSDFSDGTGAGTLRNCLANIDDDGTITFSSASSEIITVNTALQLTADGVTIDGAGEVTIKRGSGTNHSLLEINGTPVAEETTTLRGLTFDGQNVDVSVSGGAVYVNNSNTKLDIQSSVFQNNKIIGSGDGGAINAAGDVSITDSTFTLNFSGDDGGAIDSSGNVDADTVMFIRNQSADKGGAINSSGGVISDSYFYANKSTTSRGGAIDIGSNAEIRNTSFVANAALDDDGGAIDAGSNLAVVSSYFIDNSADGDGGAIRASSGTFVNSTFINNSATGAGGGVDIYIDDSSISYSTFVNNTASSRGPSVAVRDGDSGVNPIVDLFANLFLSSTSNLNLDAKVDTQYNEVAAFNDLGANVSTGAETDLDDPTSKVSFDYSSLGVGTPETASLTLRPFVPFSSLSAVGVEVTQALADNYEAATSETLPVVDQQGTARTFSFYPGAEVLTFVPPITTPAPYTGPLITNIGSTPGAITVSGSESVVVSGERLSTVSKVFINGLEGEVISTSADSFVMTVPEGLDPGRYDLQIQSSLGNLTYLDAFVITQSVASNEVAANCDGQSMSYWTKRISDSQAKVYIKCPEIGKKYRILQQTGGSGDYDVPFVKTINSLDDSSLVVNEFGTYIVRTIELEEINRIRISVDSEDVWKVRYNN